MRHHIDALGLVSVAWGAFAIVAGLSLAVLAAGTWSAVLDLGLPGRTGPAAVWVFVVGAVALAGWGLMSMAVGRGVERRRPVSRRLAIALAAPNLVLVPFGTALGIYTCWVLLNDDARREFGRSPRGTPLHP